MYNKEPYIVQAKKRTTYMQRTNSKENVIDELSKNASPDVLLDLLSYTLNYVDDYVLNSESKAREESMELMEVISESIDFQSCNDIENLRALKSIIDIEQEMNDFRNIYLREIKKKCDQRIKEISKTRKYSIKDAIETSLTELHLERTYSRNEIMLDFIESQIEKSKQQGIFATGPDMKEKIIEANEKKKDIEEQSKAISDSLYDISTLEETYRNVETRTEQLQIAIQDIKRSKEAKENTDQSVDEGHNL